MKIIIARSTLQAQQVIEKLELEGWKAVGFGTALTGTPIEKAFYIPPEDIRGDDLTWLNEVVNTSMKPGSTVAPLF